MKALAIARINLVRFFRDRSSIFMVFVFPVLLVLVLGAMGGGSNVPRLGFVAPAGDALAEELRNNLVGVGGLEVEDVDDGDSAIRGVERGELQAALILQADYEGALRSGADAQIRVVARTGQDVQSIERAVETAVTRQSTLLRAARFIQNEGVGSFDSALPVAEQVQAGLPPVAVETTVAGEPWALASVSAYDVFSQTNLVLFIFITTLGGAVNLIQTRHLGISRRMYGTPTTVSTMLTGEALSRMLIALIQGGFIFVGTWLIFGTDWGSPSGAILTILVFAMVSTGAAMLLGALARNEEQANGLSTAFGLGLAALGGAMIPLVVFEQLSDTVYQVAHISPHAWALESFITLVAEDGGVGDIAIFLLILLGYAAIFFGLAVWRLSRVLVR